MEYRIWSPPGRKNLLPPFAAGSTRPAIQQERYQSIGISCNAKLPAPAVNRFALWMTGLRPAVPEAFETMGLSARAYDRILKVSTPSPIWKSGSHQPAPHCRSGAVP
ncbi:MAG: hypothetical protein ACLRXC_07955 [[Clostridium] leptum]